MKTYILDAYKRIKRFSEKFDVSTTLCDRTWVVFNDTGERELYIFQPDGTAFITKNGVGIKGKWHWVSANQSLIINKDDNVIMLHPEYIDKTILALNLDGTNKMAFLIEEKHLKTFSAKTLNELEQYFVNKEKLLIAEQNRKIEEENRKRIEEEKRRKAEEEERLRKQRIMFSGTHKNDAKKLRKELETESCGCITLALTVGCLPILLYLQDQYYPNSGSTLYGIWFLFYVVFYIISHFIDDKRTKKRINKWKEEHPYDYRNDYL